MEKIKGLFSGGEEGLEVRSGLANFGCGTTLHEEWDNFDLVPSRPGVRRLDLSRPLPFPTEGYVAIYSSHVLEHFDRGLVRGFLSEVFRVLKPGGIFRVVVPDLEKIVRAYVSAMEEVDRGEMGASERHEWLCLELIDQTTRSFSGGYMGRYWASRPLPQREWILDRMGEEAGKIIESVDRAIAGGARALSRKDIYVLPREKREAVASFREGGEIHRWMYDRVSLRRLLEEVGFREIRVCGATESRIRHFVSYQLDTDAEGKVRKPDSLFMEAER